MLKESFNRIPNILRYKPLIVSGCSGAGKSCLINFLISEHGKKFQLSPSYTTREPRPDEVPGVHYIFSTPEEFTMLQKNKAFIESFNVHGNMYGTHIGEVTNIINNGKVCVLDLDIQGGEVVHKRFPEWNFHFVKPPTLSTLRSRLETRNTESSEAIKCRLKNAKNEIRKLESLNFYEIIINEDLDEAKRDLVSYLNSKYSFEL